MLHAKSRGVGGRFCANFEVRMEKSDHERTEYPGSGEGEVRGGGEAGCRGKDGLLWRRGGGERVRPDHAKPLWGRGEGELPGGRGSRAALRRGTDGAGGIAHAGRAWSRR